MPESPLGLSGGGPTYVESMDDQRERVWRALATSDTAVRPDVIAKRVCLSDRAVRFRLQELVQRGRATRNRGWYRAAGHGATDA